MKQLVARMCIGPPCHTSPSVPLPTGDANRGTKPLSRHEAVDNGERTGASHKSTPSWWRTVRSIRFS